MRRLLFISLIFSLFYSEMTLAQDSLFFFKSGKIDFKVHKSDFDSISFVAPDYYQHYRSDVVLNDLKANSQLTLFAQMIQIAGYLKKN